MGLDDNLHDTTAEPATEMFSVAAVAPAKVISTSPTDLHHCLRRLADGSRAPTPEGSRPAFAGGNVAAPIRPITDRPSLAPSSFTRCPVRSSCDFPSGECQHRRATGLPRSAGGTPGGLGRASTPVVPHLRVPSSERHNLTTCLLAQACQHLWLGLGDDAYDASPGLTLPPNPGPRPPRCW